MGETPWEACGGERGSEVTEEAITVLNDEISKVAKSLATAEDGAQRHPNDEEWQTLRDCAAEHLKSLERVKAALDTQPAPASAP